MTPEEIEANAVGDTDNPPLTEGELDRMSAAILAKEARAAVGLSQARFAKTFRINPARLRDLEQGRHAAPDSALVAYLTVIRREPEAVNRALADAR